jgi:hypothetical protein
MCIVDQRIVLRLSLSVVAAEETQFIVSAAVS